MTGHVRDRRGRRRERNAAEDRGDPKRRQEPTGRSFDDADQAVSEPLHVDEV